MAKCERCKKPSETTKQVLWRKGPNGFRKYRICEKCMPAVEADNTSNEKKQSDVQIHK